MDIAVGLIRVILAVVVSVTDVCWVCTDTSATLELTGSAFKLRAGGGLVGSVAAVVLSVTLPPERDTLVILAHKLAGGAVRHALFPISGQVEVIWTGTFIATTRRQQTQVTAAAIVCLTRVIRDFWLSVGVVDVDVHGSV